MTKRAVLYARVSGDDSRNDGRNITGQIEMCRDYAQRQGWSIVAELAEDERGVSGASWNNPELNRALDMARAGQFDVLVVRELDRLARGLAKQLVLEEELRRCGVDLTYVLGDYANTPEGNLMKNVRAVVAEYERLKIAERSARGRRLKAASGRWPADGHAGYGYRKVGKGKEAELEINEEEAAIVRRIFKMYIGEDGRPLALQTIATSLTTEGIPPPNRGCGKARPGKGWYRGTLRNLISSRRYIGEFIYGDIKVNLPELAIIDDETFAAAQRRRSASKAATVKARKYDYLLSGHITCSCGGSMNGAPMQKGKYLYYGCTRKTNSRHLDQCEEKYIRADVADPLVWAWLHSIICDEEKLERGLRRLISQRASDLEPKQARLAVIEDLICGTEQKIKRLTTAFASELDDVLAKAFRAELNTAAHELEALQAERESINVTATQLEISEGDIRSILDLAGEIRSKMLTPTFEQKRALLNVLKVQVELVSEGNERCLQVTCTMTLTQAGKPHQKRLRFSNLGQKSLSTTTM